MPMVCIWMTLVRSSVVSPDWGVAIISWLPDTPLENDSDRCAIFDMCRGLS